MPEVLSGERNTVTLNELRTLMSDFLGFSPNDQRLQSMVLTWLNSTLREIQLKDPHARRLKVVDAQSTILADNAGEIVDVRDSEEDGGFGWDNCEEVALLIVPGYSVRPLEPITHDQLRSRSLDPATTGPSSTCVFIDQFRVKFYPVPTADTPITGDYFQFLPKVTDGTGGIDFPSQWGAALEAGVKYKGMQWLHSVQPGAWVPLQSEYKELLGDLKENERVTASSESTRAVSMRSRRRRGGIPHDNSADVRGWWPW